MVWGVIMGNRKTDLVVVQGNINEQRYVADVLNSYALPFLSAWAWCNIDAGQCPPSCSQGHYSILAAKQCQRHAMARGFPGSQPN